jgi:hypothetical protein
MARASIPSYATLLNTKKVVEIDGSPYVQVESHFFKECALTLLEQIQVDEAWYLAKYPDIKLAIASGEVSDAGDHFVRFGYYEHRWPRQIVVDEPWYLRAYPDVKRAMQRGSFDSAQEHFEAFGFREGRLPFANFALAAEAEPTA